MARARNLFSANLLKSSSKSTAMMQWSGYDSLYLFRKATIVGLYRKFSVVTAKSSGSTRSIAYFCVASGPKSPPMASATGIPPILPQEAFILLLMSDRYEEGSSIPASSRACFRNSPSGIPSSSSPTSQPSSSFSSMLTMRRHAMSCSVSTSRCSWGSSSISQPRKFIFSSSMLKQAKTSVPNASVNLAAEASLNAKRTGATARPKKACDSRIDSTSMRANAWLSSASNSENDCWAGMISPSSEPMPTTQWHHAL
mmetsp:Transcript_19345/g.37996  ORF Transcript_19345/g.37996 Transcript_19345/m.37996 type:complete len:255 (+) Transcript_19345:720-1484(+)